LYVDLPIRAYLEKVCAGEAVPGGGSVTALAGALAAGLTAMVAGLTAGRKGFETVVPEIQRAAAAAANLMERCLELTDADPEAYRRVMAALKLPQRTPEEQADRNHAVQAALEKATRLPLQVAELAIEILELAGWVVGNGNPNAAADGAVAALMARSAGLGGIFNARTNMKLLEKKQLIETLASTADVLESKIRAAEKQVLDLSAGAGMTVGRFGCSSLEEVPADRGQDFLAADGSSRQKTRQITAAAAALQNTLSTLSPTRE